MTESGNSFYDTAKDLYCTSSNEATDGVVIAPTSNPQSTEQKPGHASLASVSPVSSEKSTAPLFSAREGPSVFVTHIHKKGLLKSSSPSVIHRISP